MPAMPEVTQSKLPPDQKPLLPLEHALSSLLDAAIPLACNETLALPLADGRVLAQDLYSDLDVPAFDNSAMDGYALCAANAQSPNAVLPVALRVGAGDAPGILPSESAARIFTGAPIPQGADCVVMQEHCVLQAATDITPTQLRLQATPEAGQNVRKKGSDVTRGSLALACGTRLGPAELGLAASLGFDRLTLGVRPRVCLFSTGDELCMPGSIAPSALPAGAIFNSNRFFLQAGLERLGCVVTCTENLPDNLQATEDALETAAKTHDVILTSGGVSVGEADHVKAAVQSLGELKLWRLAIKPGKPFAYGRIGQAHFMGLPGNPVSSYVTFLLLVRPFLLRLQGQKVVEPWFEAAIADFSLKADSRRNFVRVRRDAAQRLHLYSDQSSGVLTSVVWGDGLADVPIGRSVSPGDCLRLLPFSAFF